MHIFFRRVDFCSRNVAKYDFFKKDQKERKNKAEKIIFQGNLNSSFVFLF